METQNDYDEIDSNTGMVLSIESLIDEEQDEESAIWNVYENYAKFDDPDELEDW